MTIHVIVALDRFGEDDIVVAVRDITHAALEIDQIKTAERHKPKALRVERDYKVYSVEVK